MGNDKKGSRKHRTVWLQHQQYGGSQGRDQERGHVRGHAAGCHRLCYPGSREIQHRERHCRLRQEGVRQKVQPHLALHCWPQLRLVRHARDEALHLLLLGPGCHPALQVRLSASPAQRVLLVGGGGSVFFVSSVAIRSFFFSTEYISLLFSPVDARGAEGGAATHGAGSRGGCCAPVRWRPHWGRFATNPVHPVRWAYSVK